MYGTIRSLRYGSVSLVAAFAIKSTTASMQLTITA